MGLCTVMAVCLETGGLGFMEGLCLPRHGMLFGVDLGRARARDLRAMASGPRVSAGCLRVGVSGLHTRRISPNNKTGAKTPKGL